MLEISLHEHIILTCPKTRCLYRFKCDTQDQAPPGRCNADALAPICDAFFRCAAFEGGGRGRAVFYSEFGHFRKFFFVCFCFADLFSSFVQKKLLSHLPSPSAFITSAKPPYIFCYNLCYHNFLLSHRPLQKLRVHAVTCGKKRGDAGVRTLDPLHAKEM